MRPSGAELVDEVGGRAAGGIGGSDRQLRGGAQQCNGRVVVGPRERSAGFRGELDHGHRESQVMIAQSVQFGAGECTAESVSANSWQRRGGGGHPGGLGVQLQSFGPHF